MEAAVGNKLAKVSGTMAARFEWFIRKLLKCLFDLAAFNAFIFVKGHWLKSPFGLFRPFQTAFTTVLRKTGKK